MPHSWTAEFADLRDYRGVAWYRRAVTVPALGPDETAVLHFGAVDYAAEVWVNGRPAGRHEGGYTPVRLDVGPHLRTGENWVTVRVVDPAAAPAGTEGLTFETVPHGKQSWYVGVGGIWQPVRLEVRPERRVERVHVTAGLDGRVRVAVGIVGEGAAPLSVRVVGPDGAEALRLAAAPGASDTVATVEGVVPGPALWSPETPALYTAEVALGADRQTERFGFREVEARGRRLWLNGAPLFMIGALDQDFWPGTVYTPPSDAAVRARMRAARALGFNLLRMHVKVPDPRYLQIADEEGMLVWLDLPNHETWTPAAARRLERTFHDWVARDWNRPSLVAVSLVNESWGVDLEQAEQRAWLLGFVERAEAAVPGWLVVDNSACWGNYHLRTDLADWHTYWAIPEGRARFDGTVLDLASDPDWLWSPHGDAVRTGQEPIVLSEFGNWGLPDVPDPLPWWLQAGLGDVRETVPAGVHDRFRAHGYETVFGSFAGLAEAAQRAQARALRYQVETLRATPGIAGYVVTELTDLYWEANGVLTVEGETKAGMDALAPLQRPDVLVARPVLPAAFGGGVASMDVWASHFGPPRGPSGPDGCCAAAAQRAAAAATGPGVVRWEVEGGGAGRAEVASVGAGETVRVAPVDVQLPAVDRPRAVRVRFRWEREGGELVAETEADVHVFPAVEPVRAAVHDPAGRLRDVPNLAPDPAAGVLVSPDLDARTLAHLAAGGRAVVFADTLTELPAGFALRLTPRESEDRLLDGHWVTNVNWVRHTRPPFDQVSFGPTLGMEAAGVGLGLVVEGVPPDRFSDVLAGMFVGWVHENVGYAVQMNVGPGRLLLVTMRPRQAVVDGTPLPWASVYDAHLVRALVDYAGSDAMAPTLSWTP